MSTSPLLNPDFHIRWSELKPEHVGPGIAAALQRAQASIDVIAGQSAASLSYESTFLALEKATEELNAAWGKVSHIQSVADSPAWREAQNAMLAKVTGFYASIPLHAALWESLQAFSRSAAATAVAGIHRRFMTETLNDFRQAGADLPAEKRARLEALQSELAELTQKYGENVLDATNAWQLVVPETEEARLAGLPAHAKAAARRSAESKGLAGWRFTLHMPSVEPFMTYVEDAGLRCEMWTASSRVGALPPHDNSGLIVRILALRAEKARLLGKLQFADLTLERRMAKSGARAEQFLEEINTCAAPAFARECRELEEHKARVTGGEAGPLAPWEIMFWAERLRQSRYDFDEEILRPYLPMNAVIAGLFALVGKIFGLSVIERRSGEVETWHAEVCFYELRDRSDQLLGSFYADWHPRESKRGGAWMNYLITGGPSADGQRAPHLGLICGNMTPPADGQPALLTHREVETVFHEFGHLLHHLLGEVEIKSMNGVNVAWDFVELPSQILENWTWERASLDLFARHYQTGARIPEEVFAKMMAARNFRSACSTMRQVALAKMDLGLHMRTEAVATEGEVEMLARSLMANCLVPTEPPAPSIVKRFTHIFSEPTGYAAGYYSYKWAEVLEADAFTRFQNEGIFNASVGAEFVTKILSKGNSADPADLFRDFMGREPDPRALLLRSGLAV